MDRRTASAFAGASALLDHGVRDQLRLSWRLFHDERVSSLKYALPVLLTLYVISPIDTIPDLFLGIGQLDDLGIVMAGVLLLARLIPKIAPAHIVEEHLRDMNSGDEPLREQSRVEEDIVDASFTIRR